MVVYSRRTKMKSLIKEVIKTSVVRRTKDTVIDSLELGRMK